MTPSPILLDCTLRDGGYYNAWDFEPDLIDKYLAAMASVNVNVIEMGFRFLNNTGFKGPSAYTTDSWLKSVLPDTNMQIAVMINAADLCTETPLEAALSHLFPSPAKTSPVDIVRIACHLSEYAHALPAADWLAERGYRVGFNLMQIAQINDTDIETFAAAAANHPIDVIYFADSTGSLRPERVREIMSILKAQWTGDIGIHAHDNLGLALENTRTAAGEGAIWLDGTVTGMGRGPGNTRTEELVAEFDTTPKPDHSLVPLMEVIGQYFNPMKYKYGWGTNPYYYMAGKAGIHPTYVQCMLNDPRFDDEDIFAVIDTLSQIGKDGFSRFSTERLESALSFYAKPNQGAWQPAEDIEGQDVLLLGTGPGVKKYQAAIEDFILTHRPIVAALNTQADIDTNLIDFRFASHPVRMMADVSQHRALIQPIVAPFSALPKEIARAFEGLKTLDFGLQVKPNCFEFNPSACVCPTYLVFAYALAALNSGGTKRIFLAGFDGYSGGDPRAAEMRDILNAYRAASTTPLIAITPTRHDIQTISPFGHLEFSSNVQVPNKIEATL